MVWTTSEVAGHNETGTELGLFALGEFIYSRADKRLERLPWMKTKSPAIIPRFDVSNLSSRRSFVFAKAGFGKSNLVKLLFSDLYATIPTERKRDENDVPAGTIIFDPESSKEVGLFRLS